MRNMLYKRTAAPALVCIVAFLAVCGQRAFGYNRMGNDRILLMNDDSMMFRSVTGQSYHNTNRVNETGYYWTHDNLSPGITAALKPRYAGTNHVFYAVNGDGNDKILWRVVGAYAGTMLSSASTANYIPGSQSAVTSHCEWAVGKKTYAATNANCEVIFANVSNAYVQSSLLMDGIGTIYFDAVNTATATLTHQIGLQIATNTISGVALDETVPEEDYRWDDAPMEIFFVSNKSSIDKLDVEDDYKLTLASQSGRDDGFYRVKSKLQHFGPIAFKIVRLTYTPGKLLGNAADIIEVDNIIASYPVKTIELHEYGIYDDTREGVAVRGWTPAFSSAFPAVGELGVRGRVSLEYLGDFTIPSEYHVTTDITVNKVTMNYRWRYLDQMVNDWRTLEMRRIDDDGLEWETVDELDLTDGLGDVEYSFAAEIYSPYYLYADYTGCDLVYPDGWSERISSVERVADAEESFSKSTDRISPAGGQDFFVRLREGRSQYEVVQLLNTVTGLVSVVTNEEEVAEGADPLYELQPYTEVMTNSLEIVADHLWRGYMKVGTNHTEYADFHFVGLNLTENGASSLPGNATHWKPVDGVITADALPYSGLVEVTEEPQDSKVELDSAQEYLMFEFNDQFGTFTITHADYQNFNIWTDARGDAFVGDASSGTTGVSRLKAAYTEPFTNQNIKTSDMLSTNKYWTEKFNAGNEANIQAAWKRNIPFVSKLSPYGWTCDNGEWASEKFITNNLAFRMAGCGYGAISLQNLTEPMNGVDTFTFKARLSQYLGFDSFSYNETKTTDKNYGMMTGAAMSTSNGGDMSPETPTISLVSYYRPNEGCYEFRATRYDEYVVKLEIYKWIRSGYAVVANRLYSTDITADSFGGGSNGRTAVKSWLQNGTFGSGSMQLYGMYMWVTNDIAAPYTARICAGIARERKSVSAATVHPFFGYSRTDLDPANNKFFRIECSDSSNPLRRGAYGVGANDCRARFNAIYRNDMTSGFSPEKDMSTSERSEFTDGNWTPAIGRANTYNASSNEYGITTDVTPQPIGILFAPAPEGATKLDNIEWTDQIWHTVSPADTVSDFQNKTFTVTVHSTSNYFPRLQHAAGRSDPRTDITVDDLEIKGYRGVPATTWTSSSQNQWVWTETWLERVNKTTIKCRFWPDRVNPTYPLSLRSPLVDGISMLNFTYEGAQPGVKMYVQIWTNGIEYVASDLPAMTCAISDPDWVTVDTFTVNSGDVASGSHTTYFALRSPIKGIVRLMMDPEIVTAAANHDSAASAKKITITSITVWDEPKLDEYSWTGWNMRTTDETDKAYLPDPATVPAGLSGALNNSTNSVTGNLKRGTPAVDYGYHNPYVQSPLSECGIGLVSFKARKYTDSQDAATVSVLGASDPSLPDGEWTTLTNIVVDSKAYKTYGWTISGDSSPYKSIRFTVDGVAHNHSVPTYKLNPQRVLIEEVVVSEPVAPRLKFAAAMPFRSGLFEEKAVTNLLSCEQQPLVGENFGFQVELKLNQLADELDEDSLEVHVAYYHGSQPWGWRNWIDREDAVKLTLPAVRGTNLIYRSSYDDPLSLVPPVEQTPIGVPNVLQYHVWATYRKKGEGDSGEPNRHDLSEDEWTHGASSEGTYSYPEWYWPCNFNETEGDGKADNFSAYTLLDTVSPYRAWINEFNIYDGEADEIPTNQFIEVAVPVGADLTGWYVRAFGDDSYGKQDLFVFGENENVPAVKVANATNHYAFVSVASPETQNRQPGRYDGRWSTTFPVNHDYGADGRLNYFESYALELVRPTGIIEQQIVVSGTNIYLNGNWEYYYSGTNFLAKLLSSERKGCKWTYNGADMTAGTLGAMSNYGQGGLAENGGTWEVDLMPTAGFVNRRWDGTCEYIDENWFLEANGTNVWVYATVVSDHLAQKSGVYKSNAFRIVLPHGITTNIVYEADDWWRIAYVNMNGKPVPEAVDKKNFTLVLKDLTNNVDVVAAAAPSSALTNGTGFVSDETNPYAPAVMDWLGRYPETNDDGSLKELKRTWLYDQTGLSRFRQLTLTEMYWLDIPPTQQCYLWAGMKDGVMGRCPEPVLYTNWVDGVGHVLTNIRVTVFMMITNLEENTAWAPSHLQTVDGIQSDDYVLGSEWPGVTFKVEGQLPNVAPNSWVPLRYFLFQEGSFKAPTGAADDFCARIEVLDPFDSGSAAFDAGWSRYRFVDNPLLRWNLNSDRVPMSPDVLKPDSTYK